MKRIKILAIGLTSIISSATFLILTKFPEFYSAAFIQVDHIKFLYYFLAALFFSVFVVCVFIYEKKRR